MAEQVIDTVVTKFVADVKDYMSGAKEVSTSLKVLGGLAGTVAVGISTVLGTAFSRLNDMAEESTEFNRFAKSIGMSIEKLQQWEYAVSQTGGSLKSLQGSLAGLTTKLDAIPLQGNSPVLVMLNRLGINAYSAGGGIKKASDILLELSSRMKGMSNSQAYTIGKMLGIDTATIQLLQKGRREVESLLKKGKETSVYTKEYADRLEKLKIAQENNSRQWKKAGDTIALIFLPVLEKVVAFQTKLATAMANTAVWIKEHTRLFKAIGIAITGIAGAIAIINFPAIVAGVLSVGSAFVSWLPAVFVIGVIAGAIAGVILLIEDWLTWLEGGESELGSFYEKCSLFLDIAKDYLMAPIKGLWNLAKQVFNGIISLWGKVTNYFKSKDLGDILLDVLTTLLGKIPYFGKKIKEALRNAIGGNTEVAQEVIGKSYENPIQLTESVKKSTNATPWSTTNNNETTTVNYGGVKIEMFSNDPLTAGRDVQQTLVNQSNWGGSN